MKGKLPSVTDSKENKDGDEDEDDVMAEETEGQVSLADTNDEVRLFRSKSKYSKLKFKMVKS